MVQRDVDEAAAEADVAAPNGVTRPAKPNTIIVVNALLTRATTLSPKSSMLRCPDTLAEIAP